MNRLVLLAATFIFSTGIMLAQSSPTAGDTGKPNAAPEQAQPGTKATPPLVPHQPPETSADGGRPGATPQTTLPSTDHRRSAAGQQRHRVAGFDHGNDGKYARHGPEHRGQQERR